MAPSVVAATLLLSSGASAAVLTNGTIDSFDGAPVTLHATAATPDSDQETAAADDQVLGGVRTTSLVVNGLIGTANLAIAQSTNGLLTASANGSPAQAQLVWDGGGSGLGGVDLTAGGTLSGLVLRVVASSGVTATVTVSSAGNACSTGSTTVGANQSTQRRLAAVIPLSALTVGGCSGTPSGPVDLTQATAVELVLTVPAGGSVSLGSFYLAALDHGDLPDSYATLTASNGPANVIDTTLRLGAAITGTPDGLPTVAADADPSDDGVSLTRGRTFTPGTSDGAFDVAVVGAGCLSAWADWAGDGSFSQPGDLIVSHQPVATGTVTIAVATPAPVVLPLTLSHRWRLFAADPDGSCTSPELPTGADIRGETEDYVTTLTPAPSAPTLVTSPATPANDPSPSWTFTTQDPSDVPTCTLTPPTGSDLPLPCSSGTATAGPLGTDAAAQGTYTLSVTATDPLGRVSPAATSTFVYDSVSPGLPTFVSAPATPSNRDLLTWTWTVPSDAQAWCQLVPPGGSTTSPTLGPCPATGRTFDLTGQDQGDYTLLLQARDPAGNVSSTVSTVLTRDTVPPAQAGLVRVTDSPGSSRAVTWTLSVPSDATATCTLTEADGTVDEAESCAGSYVATLNNKQDGTYGLSVLTRDEAGNHLAPVTSTYVLDTTTSPAVFTSTPDAAGRSLAPAWTFRVDADATATCTLTEGAVTVAVQSSCGPTFSPTLAHVATGAEGLGRVSDGSLVLTVHVTDALLNVARDAVSTYLLDTVAPTTPTLHLAELPASPGSSTTPRWTFDLEPGSHGHCSVSGPAGPVDTDVPCAGSFAPDLSAAGGDGDYSFSVYAVDDAGNQSTTVTSDYVLDRTAGSATLDTSPPSVGNQPNVSWTFHTDGDTSPQCRLQSPTATLDWAPCTSPFPLSAGSDGSYVFSVRAVDAAGNEGDPVTSRYVLDTVAPAAPVLTERPVSPATDRSPHWAFTIEAGAHATCTLTGTLTLAPAACNGTFDPSLDQQADGSYTVTVAATDAAGNTGPALVSAYVLDTTAADPVITTSPASPGNSRSPRWTFTTGPGDVAQCRLTRGTTVISPWAGCTAALGASLTNQADGTYTFAVRASDALRNVSAVVTSDYTLDTVAPAAPTITGTPGEAGSNRSPVWAFSSSGGALVRCRLVQEGGATDEWTPCSGRYTADLTGRPDGTWHLEVEQIDQAGNESPVASAGYVLDTMPPAVPVFTSGGGTSNNPAVSWSFTTEAASTTACRLTGPGATVLVDWQPCTGSFAAALANQPDGIYVLSVRATDPVGNVSPATTSAFSLDRVPPGAPVIVDETPSSSDRTPQFSFRTETGAALQTRALDGGGSPSWSTPAGFASLDLGGAGAGDYRVEARAVDAAGNVSPSTTATYRLVVVVTSDQTRPETDEHETPHPAPAIIPVRPVVPPRPSAPPPVTPTAQKPLSRLPAEDVAPVSRTRKPAGAPAADAAGGTHRERSLIGDIGGGVGTALSSAGASAAFPVALVLLLIGFLTVQNRLDRGDPKLASAPVHGDDRWILFS